MGAVPPLMPVAVKVTDAPGQIVVADAAMETDGVIRSFTVITITLLVTEAGAGQTAFEVTITVTLSVLVSVEEVKVELFVPTFTPFTCHWYEGLAPAFVGVAVKVTLVPAQILLPGLAEIKTEGTVEGVTVTVAVPV